MVGIVRGLYLVELKNWLRNSVVENSKGFQQKEKEPKPKARISL
tara:strand:- start:404 stop:535 length:132 start_codon:yes stop_codon:yes gene_type:complete